MTGTPPPTPPRPPTPPTASVESPTTVVSTEKSPLQRIPSISLRLSRHFSSDVPHAREAVTLGDTERMGRWRPLHNGRGRKGGTSGTLRPSTTKGGEPGERRTAERRGGGWRERTCGFGGGPGRVTLTAIGAAIAIPERRLGKPFETGKPPNARRPQRAQGFQDSEARTGDFQRADRRGQPDL